MRTSEKLKWAQVSISILENGEKVHQRLIKYLVKRLKDSQEVYNALIEENKDLKQEVKMLRESYRREVGYGRSNW